MNLEVNVQAPRVSCAQLENELSFLALSCRRSSFTCFTTDTCMSWTWLCSGRLKWSGQRCYKQYIGETGWRLSNRFGNTCVRWRASNRTPATTGLRSPWPDTSIYLTQPSPWYASVCGKASERGTATRQREERRLIFQLDTRTPGGSNINFKFL